VTLLLAFRRTVFCHFVDSRTYYKRAILYGEFTEFHSIYILKNIAKKKDSEFILHLFI